MPLKPNREAHHFCTLFDTAYAPRGILMMNSLLRFLPDAQFHVLCLDDTVSGIVQGGLPQAHIISLPELEAFDPELARHKADRSRIEYYFTCTPCLPLYVAEKSNFSRITYLDADLFFYGSPQLVFDEIGDAPIAISPHRFAPLHAHNAILYGRYNVGWLSWNNDAEGRRCLQDYRDDCLAWCFDRPERGRYADQKYLDDWPERYPGTHILQGKGMNLAIWNVENYVLGRSDESIMVDADPLVFFHFHGIQFAPPNRIKLPGARSNFSFLVKELYVPYLNLLYWLTEWLAWRHQIDFASSMKAPRFKENEEGLLPSFTWAPKMATKEVALDYYKPTQPLVLCLEAEGEISIGEEAVAAEDLRARLSLLASDDPDRTVYIRGNPSISYGTILKTLEIVKAVGFRKVPLFGEGPLSQSK